MRSFLVTCGILFLASSVVAQNNGPELTFSRADTLRGLLTPIRSCFDVTYYHLDIKVDPAAQTVTGSNRIKFKAVSDFNKMQIDLAENMKIDRVIFHGKPMPFKRELTAVYVTLPRTVKKGEIEDIVVEYGGKPRVAPRPPWDGGLIWRKDENGNPWVAVTVQGDGAMLWWPNKEHQSDEPDSMLISVTVPDTLMDISNGRLRKAGKLGNGWARWDWFVSYPINNYNVTLNIGKFAHLSDFYVSADGDTLTCDYYVLPYNVEKAKEQFQQVHPMFEHLEKWFGKYPFYRDGYKLVESPHNGMEHQTAVAYGNGFRNGYRFQSQAEVGLKFDFIIIHETAHEWWGNNVTGKDIADMWIHESFGAYTEALYVESMWGREQMLRYQFNRRPGIVNDRPIIGVYGVNNAGSKDMYSKGAVVLGTLRSVINNDSLWAAILRGIQEKFAYQTVTAEDIFGYINEMTGTDFNYFFDQYFRHTGVPELEIQVTKQGDRVSARYKWNAEVADFHMPIEVTTNKGVYEFIYPTTQWQETELGNIHPDDFQVAEMQYYVTVKKSVNFRLPDIE